MGLCLPASMWAQTSQVKVDHASSYYYFTLAHFYADLAGAVGNRGEYVNKAIENYKAALKADPTSPELSEELSEFYFATGRFRDAQNDAEEALKTNPNDVNAHRMLARIYTRQIGEGQNGRIDEAMLRKTIDEYKKVTQLDPKDADSWVMLGRLQKASQNSVDARLAYEKALEVDPDNEDALTGIALIYSEMGDNQKAADALRRANDKNPSQRGLLALAGVYEQMRQYDFAAETLKKALDLNPPNATELKTALAQDYFAANRLNEALAVYQELIMEDASDSQSYLRMSQIYRQQRDYEKAHQISAKALSVDPQNMEIRYNEAVIYEAEGKTDKAIQAVKDILASTSKRNYSQQDRKGRIGLLEGLAAIQRNADQTEQAAESFRQVMELEPDLAPQVTAEIIETYRTGKMFSKAEQEADAAVKKYPQERVLIETRARLLADVGKVDEAANSVKKLMDGKNDRQTYLVLAEVYDKGKKFSDEGKALDAAEKLSQADDDKMVVWFQRGAMYEHMKNVEAAEAEFRKVLKIDPENAGAMNYVGYMLADRNMRLDEALKLIQRAVDKEPENGAYLDSLGWVFYRLGRYSEAEDVLRRAVEKTPKDPTVHDHFAETLLKQNKVKEAVDQLQASVREWETSSASDRDAQEEGKVKSKLEAAKTRLARDSAKK